MNASLFRGRGVYRFCLGLCAAALPFAATGQWATNNVWMQGGHGGKVNALACAADGSIIVTAGDDQSVKLWTTNGTLLRTFATTPYTATAVALSPDGSKLAIGTYSGGYVSAGNLGSGQVFLWQAPGGWLAPSVSLVWSNNVNYGKVTSLTFSPDNRILAAGNGSGSNYIFNATASGLVATLSGYTGYAGLNGTAPVNSLAFSANGLLASGAEDSTLRVWGTNGWAITNVPGHASNVTAVAFSPGGGYLATASLDQTIRVWNTKTWACVKTNTGPTSGFTSLAFSSDGATLAGGTSNGVINVWNWQTGSLVTNIAAHSDVVRALMFLPDGARLVSGSDDSTARIWSAATGTLLAQLGVHPAAIRAVAISPDGTLCASVDDAQTIEVRNTRTGELVRSLAGQSGCVSAIAFSPDSAKIVSGGGPLDPTIKVWRISDGSLLRSIAATTNGVMALAWSPDGSLIASGGDSVEQTINLWNAADGSWRTNLPGHTNGVTALAFSPNGGLLASGGRRLDNAVKIWSLTNSSLYRSFSFSGHTNNIESVAFAPDNNTLAFGTSGAGNFGVAWVGSGASQFYPSGTNQVLFVAFTPDGNALAAASRDTIQFWQVTSTNLIQTLNQETFQTCAVAYSPNANLFLYGRGDATLVLATNSLGALGQPQLQFNSLVPGPLGAATLGATVQPQTHYVIQSSPDLANWSFLTLAVTNTSSLLILDTNAPASRFYRAITPP